MMKGLVSGKQKNLFFFLCGVSSVLIDFTQGVSENQDEKEKEKGDVINLVEYYHWKGRTTKENKENDIVWWWDALKSDPLNCEKPPASSARSTKFYNPRVFSASPRRNFRPRNPYGDQNKWLRSSKKSIFCIACSLFSFYTFRISDFPFVYISLAELNSTRSSRGLNSGPYLTGGLFGIGVISKFSGNTMSSRQYNSLKNEGRHIGTCQNEARWTGGNPRLM